MLFAAGSPRVIATSTILLNRLPLFLFPTDLGWIVAPAGGSPRPAAGL
jgi:hypothetical protein